MPETWVYHTRRNEQHAVSQWGYWGVNFKCGLATSHTVLAPCVEGQRVCAVCGSGIDAYYNNEPTIHATTIPPTIPPGALEVETVGYITPGADVVPDDDEWE